MRSVGAILTAGLILSTVVVATVNADQPIVRRSRYERADLGVSYTDTTDAGQVQALRKKYGIPAGADLTCPSGGSDVVFVVYRHNLKMGQGMAIPTEDVPAFFVTRQPEGFYAVRSNEPVRIGGHVYSFKNTANSLIVNYVKDGSVSAKDVGEGNAWITADGYMFQRWGVK